MMSVAEDRPEGIGLLRPVVIAIIVQLAMTATTISFKLRAGRDDTDIYYHYATLIRSGKIPYRDFRVEYPPLAIPLFLLPAYSPSGVMGFKIAFGIEMLIFNAATVWLVARWVADSQAESRVRIALVRYTILYLLLSRLFVSRYDAATMFLGFAASTRWFSGRVLQGGLSAALGTLTKVYPAVIATLAGPWEIRRPRPSRGLGLATFIGILTIGSLAWLAIGSPSGVAESLGYQLELGFEYGSLYSGLQMAAARVVGAEIDVVRDHAAWASVTPWSPSLMRLVLPLQAATVLGVCVVFVRRGLSQGVRFSAAAILAFILTGKVFSPQYLIWLLPFVAALDGPVSGRGFWLFTAGCVLTLVSPALTSSYSRTSIPVILSYNIKNALFVALLALWVIGPRPIGSQEGRGISSS